MHVHPSSPNSSISEENAATKIQANFRGYRVRKQIKDTTTTGSTNAAVSEVAADRSAISASSASTVMDGVGKRSAAVNGGDLLNDERDVCATKIQAGIRGFLVRKKQKMASDAATKIQANFRGFKTRQQLKRSADH